MPRRFSARQRQRLLGAALRQIADRFGPGVVLRLQDAPPRDPEDRAVPTGSLGLDLATGLGGYPRGQLTEILGDESSGKTALLYAALAATQRRGGLAALIDAEGGADPEALIDAGVDLRELLVARPASAPDALLMLATLARCGGLDALGLVSIDALRDLPAGGVRGSLDGELLGLDVARLVARGLRVLTAALRESPSAVLVANTLLPDLPGYRTPGGLALRHHAALRVLVEPLAPLRDAGGVTDGLWVAATIVKHKLGIPGGRAEVEIRLAGGLDQAAELLTHGRRLGLVERGPLGLRWGAIPLGAGEGKACRLLRADPALAEALRRAIIARWDWPVAA